MKKINDMMIGDLYIKHGVIVKSPVEKQKQKVLNMKNSDHLSQPVMAAEHYR